MERMTTTYLTRDDAEPVLLCSNTYDANGNMTRDRNKGIHCITYNMLNLPQTILFNDGHETRYTYAADGRMSFQQYHAIFIERLYENINESLL